MPIKKIYTNKFREQIVELVSMGKTPTELAREFGCDASSIRNWVKQIQTDHLGDRSTGCSPNDRRAQRDVHATEKVAPNNDKEKYIGKGFWSFSRKKEV